MGPDLTRWWSAAAAARGRAHEETERPCQDVVGRACARGVAVVALADGAGSAKHAEHGAQVAVETSLDLVVDRFDSLATAPAHEVRRTILGCVLDRLADRALALEAEGKDLGSTLLFAAVGRGRFLAGHVGDGVIGVMKDGHSAVLSEPARGEFANETVLLSGMRSATELRLFRGSARGVTGFVLMSDGAAESLHQRRTGRLAAAVDRFFAWLDENPPSDVSRALEQQAHSLLRSRTRDDCSVAVLRRVSIEVDVLPQRGVGFRRALLGSGNVRGAANRLSVLAAVAEGIGPAGAIAKATGLSLPTVQRHLRQLAEVGITTTDAKATL
jgi:DNA-binding transcriptional ArsR family regulator